ncbi:MAG: NlpC/P60 family protein [Prevotella sp.]|nr:NlpC/P60 family protein [Prevotella sp.]MCM1075567.1 NlpC/P60 family protein [Ruminococcus sp.]
MGGSCSTHKHNAKTPASSFTASQTRFKASDYINGRHLSKVQEKIIKEVCSWQGTPYKYGGAEKGKGTDCSGLILRVFLDVTDIKLPRNSAQQADFCKNLKQSKAGPCDLVFFATGSDPDKVSHVGLLLNSEVFIHSSSSKGVIVTPLNSPWWGRRIKGFGRVPGVKR